jgi:HSP20 family protein
MNRLFGSFFDAPSNGPAGGNGGGVRQWIPAMDLVETRESFILRADLPGLTEKDVTVELEDNVLSVSGERRAETTQEREGYYRIERASGRFARSLTLPDGVDATGITAHFNNGVLEVTVPKPTERKPHRVTIGVSTVDAPAGDEIADADARRPVDQAGELGTAA